MSTRETQERRQRIVWGSALPLLAMAAALALGILGFGWVWVLVVVPLLLPAYRWGWRRAERRAVHAHWNENAALLGLQQAESARRDAVVALSGRHGASHFTVEVLSQIDWLGLPPTPSGRVFSTRTSLSVPNAPHDLELRLEPRRRAGRGEPRRDGDTASDAELTSWFYVNDPEAAQRLFDGDTLTRLLQSGRLVEVRLEEARFSITRPGYAVEPPGLQEDLRALAGLAQRAETLP